MRKNIKFISTVLTLMLIITVVAIGCAPQQRPTPERYGTRYYYDNRYDTNVGDGGYTDYYDNDRLYGMLDRRDVTYDNVPNNFGFTTQNVQENKIEKSCETLTNVQDCTVIKNGDTCYVGVDPTGNITNVAALRTEIANKCRAVDSTIKRVYVTMDKDRVNKLKTYARDIDFGRPVRTFLDDIENLFD